MFARPCPLKIVSINLNDKVQKYNGKAEREHKVSYISAVGAIMWAAARK
jgi:hypothetical protein